MADTHLSSVAQSPVLALPGATAAEASQPALPVPLDPDIPSGGASSNPIRRANYIARHWRGELGLGVSYWVNYWLGYFAVAILCEGVRRALAPADNPIGWAVSASLVCSITTAVTVWQLVGVWRSAAKHKARGGRVFWAGLAKLVVLTGLFGLAGTFFREAGPQLLELWKIAIGDPEVGKHQLRVNDGGTELEFVGGITFGVADEVRHILDVYPAIGVVRLTGPGGRIEEAYKLRALFHARGLVTYARSTCASACTIAFMGGSQRYLTPGAKLGFHRGSLPGLTTEQSDKENDAERRALIAMGVPEWFANHAYSTPSSSMWWPTGDELSAANVITAPPAATAAAPELPTTPTKGSWSPPKREKRNYQPSTNENPSGSNLCPPPYHLTARDGCQR
jgi:hypothetical protein